MDLVIIPDKQMRIARHHLPHRGQAPEMAVHAAVFLAQPVGCVAVIPPSLPVYLIRQIRRPGSIRVGRVTLSPDEMRSEMRHAIGVPLEDVERIGVEARPLPLIALVWLVTTPGHKTGVRCAQDPRHGEALSRYDIDT